MRFRIALYVLPLLLLAGGCVSDPVGQAEELRAIYTEAQHQVNELCAKPDTDPAKCEELRSKLQQAAPFIDAIEVAAAQAAGDPGKYIDFQTLFLQYRPKVRALLISIVLRRYLGV